MQKQHIKSVTGSIVATAILTLAAATTGFAADVGHFRSNGDYACADGPISSGYFSVCVTTDSENGNQNGRNEKTAYLTYFFSSASGWSWGSGNIPLSAVQINPDQATLVVNPASLPGFQIWGVVSGDISLTWNRTSLRKGRQSGTWSNTYGDFTYKSNGAQEWSSASSNGAVFGNAFTDADGDIGMAHSVYTTINR